MKGSIRWRAATCTCAALLLLWSGAAGAGCTVSSAGVAFGTYVPTSPAPLDSSGSLTVTCNWDSGFIQTFNYTASFSTGGAPSYVTRRMVRVGGTQQLNYNLHNSGYTQILGNGSGGTVTYSGSITVVVFFDPSNTATHVLAGRIPALQNAVPGSYLNNIVVTLNF